MIADVAATVPGLLAELADRLPDHDGAVYPTTRATFAELSDRSLGWARALRAASVGHGDVVGLVMAPDARIVELLLGIWRLGALPLPINPRFKPGEVAYVTEHSGAALLLCDGPGRTLAESANVSARAVEPYADAAFAAAGAAVDPAEVAAAQARIAPDDDAILFYTSGTTSRPKGAVHTHRSLLAEGRAIVDHFSLTPEDRFWTPLPMFHVGGYTVMMGAWANGSAYLHVGTFDADVAVQQLERERVTVAFPAFEMMWLQVLDHPRYPELDLSPLRIVVNVGVPERLAQMQARMPGIVQVSSFGLTETCGFGAIGLLDDPLDKRVGTSGRPLPGNEVRIVDPETGADLPPGERGELLFRGATRFDRYWRDPEHTAEAIDADGWFHSGDLLVADEEGRISFVGRVKDMLKVGGENVSPAEVEGRLVTHPAVKIAQVVAAPDARLAEVPCAYVELNPGSSATERELIDHCLGHISTFKVPRYVRFVEDWPQSGTKVQKARLRDMIAAELRDAGITEAPRLSARDRTAAAAG